MTINNQFDSFNGWVMPGSGRFVQFDETQCYVDENGDLWVPCSCGQQENREQEAADSV